MDPEDLEKVNEMLRQKLQSYLDKVYPGSQIITQHTLGGQVPYQIRTW